MKHWKGRNYSIKIWLNVIMMCIKQYLINQYGAEIKSVVLTLVNEGNVLMNKMRKIINWFSENTINMSEGIIVKLQNSGDIKIFIF